MKKTVLIPTDFSIRSLNVVKAVLSQDQEDNEYNFILLHGIMVPNSITDLLFFSKTKMLKSLSNEEFEDALMVIKNKYASKINSIRTDLFTGINQVAFNNYTEANEVTEVCLWEGSNLKISSKKSLDILPFIRKSALPINEINWELENLIPEKGKVAEIFHSSSAQ